MSDDVRSLRGRDVMGHRLRERAHELDILDIFELLPSPGSEDRYQH